MLSKVLTSTRSRGSTDRVPRRRAACEECRAKKLKCSGGQPACARCVRESISCTYSVQKQMGRPQKRNDVQLIRPGEPLHDEERASILPQGQTAADVMGTDVLAQYESDHIGSSRRANGWAQNDVPVESSLPGLTPDPSANSAPLHLPTELQHDAYRDKSESVLFDSSSAHSVLTAECNLVTSLPSCACLSGLYLSLNNLQQMNAPYQFPSCLHPLREAMSTANSVLQCKECPRQFMTCIQNTQILGTLLVSIAECFGKVLDAITSEAVRAEMAGETKTFRLVDLNMETGHLHTGGLGCAAAFSIGLSPEEWRSMTKKVVRAEVCGLHASAVSMSPDASDGSSVMNNSQACHTFSDTEHTTYTHLTGLVRQMLMRQERWHNDLPPRDFPLDRLGNLVGQMRSTGGDHLCMKMPTFAIQLVQSFDWT